MPTADEITVHEVLEKLDGEFSRVAAAVANREFAKIAKCSERLK
ncbi:hypothetical protein [Aminobacter sp. SR38]|nr:hypothetical protein [Aminobacter sp. SR38]